MSFDPYRVVSDPTARLAVAVIRETLGVAAEGELGHALPRDAHAWADAMARLPRAGVTPALHTTLAARELQAQVPLQVLERLRRMAIAAAAAEAVRLSALGGVLETLEPAGFEVFAIKGAALSVLMPAYAQLRPAADVDVWVPGRAANDANRLLQERGYKLRDAESAEDARKCHCPPLVSPGDGTVIEVHRRPWLSPHQADAPPCAHTRVHHEQLNRPARVPATEQLIVIQAAHAAVGDTAPGNLRTIWDVAALARLGRTDWALVAELAARIGSLRGVKAVLSRVALLGLAEVPAQVRISPRAEARVRLTWADNSRPRSTISRIWRRCAALDGPTDWLRTGLLALPLAGRRSPAPARRRTASSQPAHTPGKGE